MPDQSGHFRRPGSVINARSGWPATFCRFNLRIKKGLLAAKSGTSWLKGRPPMHDIPDNIFIEQADIDVDTLCQRRRQIVQERGEIVYQSG